MNRDELLAFMRRTKDWVEATVTPDGAPQAAVVGVVVSDAFELFFDTLGSTRKIRNLRHEPRVAFVMWVGAATVQYEGVADEPTGDDLARLKQLYFAHFPDGPERERLPGVTYVRIRPTWIRFSDLPVGTGPVLFEWNADALVR